MKRSRYQLGGYNLFTADMGYVYPFRATEVLPGDFFKHNTNALIRMDAMNRPIMHPIKAYVEHYFVAHRLTWSKLTDGTFEDFITGGEDGYDAQTVPQFTIPANAAKGALDYMGIFPLEGLSVSALPLAAMNLVLNEYYRDQDLQPTKRELTDNTLFQVAWGKDYLTTARPWEQKGPTVTIPLGTSAPVVSNGSYPTFTAGDADGASSLNKVGAFDTYTRGSQASLTGTNLRFEQTGLEADLANADSLPINTWRKAYAMQRFQEEAARYGGRYPEYLRRYGVVSPDSRLQRPELLGGGAQTLSISEVIKNNEVSSTLDPDGRPFADLGGHGITGMRTNRYARMFTEHGYVISLLFIRPKAIYGRGINRHWLYQDKEDFFQKELVHIGQQPVLNDEVYAQLSTGRNTFGWSDRYRHLREGHSYVSGEFRDQIYNDWHLARLFEAGVPALNSEFITCDPSKRIFPTQLQTYNNFKVMTNSNIKALRLVPRNAAGKVI